MVSITNHKERVIPFTIGDWSHDGHGRTEVVQIKTTASDEDIRTAYKASEKLFGFRMHSVCEEYEDHALPRAVTTSLAQHGFSFHDVDTTWIDVDAYIKIVLFFINKSLPADKALEVVENEEADLHDTLGYSFGYGLFSS